MYNLKKKYWWINYLWNKGKYFYWLKNKNIYNLKKKTKLNKSLNIKLLIRFFFKKTSYFKNIKFLNIVKKKRNVFLNMSTIKGNVLNNYSCGMLYKRGSQRRTFNAFKDLLDKILFNIEKNFNKSFFLLRIRSSSYYRAGFKRNIKSLLKLNSIKFKKYIGIKFKAHNGVRKKKKKRK